jgi:hypothetical protein
MCVVLSGCMCVVLSGCYLAKFKLARVSATPSDMGDACLLQLFHKIANSIMFI